jgi:hypothetical protein
MAGLGGALIIADVLHNYSKLCSKSHNTLFTNEKGRIENHFSRKKKFETLLDFISAKEGISCEFHVYSCKYEVIP